MARVLDEFAAIATSDGRPKAGQPVAQAEIRQPHPGISGAEVRARLTVRIYGRDGAEPFGEIPTTPSGEDDRPEASDHVRRAPSPDLDYNGPSAGGFAGLPPPYERQVHLSTTKSIPNIPRATWTGGRS